MATNRAITSNNNGAHALDVPHLARKLHVQLERYIEAQYPIRHPAVVLSPNDTRSWKQRALFHESRLLKAFPDL